MTDQTPTTPRRKRLETLNLVSITHADSNGRVDLQSVGRTLDLSEGGILLEIPTPVPDPHEIIDITIGFRDHVIGAKGRIVHQRALESGLVGLGISFIDLSEKDRSIITSFLSGV